MIFYFLFHIGLLKLPEMKLIQDCPTRWSSTYAMIERFIQQQAAIMAALMDNRMRHQAASYAVEGRETALLEDMLHVLKPIKTATTLLCSESDFTLSQILPCIAKIEKSLAVKEEDGPTLKSMKRQVLLECNNQKLFLVGIYFL